MTNRAIAAMATQILGREVTELFADHILDGDPFVYERTAREDREATNTVLGLASGRIARP